jgi:hypothetical protein
MNNGTFIILLIATFPTLSILSFLFSLGAYARAGRTDPETIQRRRDLERAVALQWRILRYTIDTVEQGRMRVRSLEDTLAATQARQEQDHNATDNRETYYARKDPVPRDTERSVNQNKGDALLENTLGMASNIQLPPNPSEQQVNGIIHEQPQELPTVADRHRDGPSVHNPFHENVNTSEDTLLDRVEEARRRLLRSMNSARINAARSSEPRASLLASGETRTPLTIGYTHFPPLRNSDRHTPLTNGYHPLSSAINGITAPTTSEVIASSERLIQHANTILNNMNSRPNPRPTTTIRVHMNDLFETLMRVLRETEPRPSEAQIQAITSEYIRQLREARQRQFEDLSENVSRLTNNRPTGNGVQTHGERMKSFHIDSGIVRSEPAINGATADVPNIKNTTTTTVWPTITPRSIPRLGGRNGAHPGFPLLGSRATNADRNHTGGVGSYGRHGREGSDDTASCWYDDNNNNNNDEENLRNPPDDIRRGTMANGRGLPSSPTNFGVTTNSINGVSRPTYATIAAENLELTGSGNWLPTTQLSSSNLPWNPTATQVIGRDGTNLTAERRFVNGNETDLDDRSLVNDTDLDEVRGFRNETRIRNGDGDGRPATYDITRPRSTSRTRSNSLSGTTLVNSIPSLSGSTLVNSSSDGDTSPPSTLGNSYININTDLYRNGAYETPLALLRRQRAISDIIARERRDAAIPIDEAGRRGAVAVKRGEPMEHKEEEKQAIKEAEESWWGLRTGRAHRRDSIEEKMVAHVLGRERAVGTGMVNGVEGDDEPHVNGVDEHGSDDNE